MPRLAPSLLHHARRKDTLLPLLLRECRDTRSAQNELKWLTEHAIALQSSPRIQKAGHKFADVSSAPRWRTVLKKLVRRRARGEPLQYILGTQPFGDLEILCERGVLIPRSETEAYTVKLAELVQDLRRAETATKRQKLRILDLCTGTGCISLLFHSLLKPPNFKQVVVEDGPKDVFANASLEILGMDISNAALRLAKNNLHHNLEQRTLHPSKHDISFARADVLSKAGGNLAVQPGSTLEPGNDLPQTGMAAVIPSVWEVMQCEGLGMECDILISNPPYISPRHFSPGGTTTRSVRRWEPQLALVPRPSQFSTSENVKRPEHENQLERGDEFYPLLLELARSVDAKVVVLEVGDDEQALRVRQMATQCFVGECEVAVEIWRDDGTAVGNFDRDCSDLGSECRAVVVWRSSWAKWRTSTMSPPEQRT
jgi:HemK-like putative methylase